MMKKLFVKDILYRSFSVRLSVYIIFVSAVVFLLVCGLSLYFAHQQVQKEAKNHAEAALENALLQIDSELRAVEVATKNAAYLFQTKIDISDSLYFLPSHYFAQLLNQFLNLHRHSPESLQCHNTQILMLLILIKIQKQYIA